MNWKAQPLVSYRVIVDLIYPKAIVVSDQPMADLNITRDSLHGEWNYTIHPANFSVAPWPRVDRSRDSNPRARPVGQS
jgi:hypothetical protein